MTDRQIPALLLILIPIGLTFMAGWWFGSTAALGMGLLSLCPMDIGAELLLGKKE